MAIDINKLKSLFIVDETKEENKDNSSTATTVVNTTQQQQQQQTGKEDAKITETLFKALSDNNLQSFDYFEFKQSLKTLRGMLDEPTAFKSAFATAATMGITKEKLIESANFYLKVLAKEKEKFDAAAKSQGAGTVDAKRKDIEAAKKSITEKSELIRKLTDEISAAQAKINELQAFIIQAESKISETSQNFVASYISVSSEITSDIEKIKQHIQ